MNAFATAVSMIFADPSMAVDAVWRAGGTGPAVTVRAIRKAPDEVTAFGAARIWSETLRVDVRTAEIASPAAGDHVVIGDTIYIVQGEPVRDRERLVWTLDLRPQ